MKRLILHILSLISLQLLIAQAKSDLPDAIQLRESPIWQLHHSLFDNPGTMGCKDTLSLSEAWTGIKTSDMDKPIVPQNGKGESTMAIAASSMLHLDHKQTVWGNASFALGKLQDVKWSNCIDYDIISPYVLGDEVGGDLSYRQYNFGGGYSCTFDNVWSMGISCSYRAEIAWRDVDPRIKTIVSDLSVTAGAGYRLSDNRIVGLSAGVRSYTQNCDLDFYNPMNEINTLTLTGLGTYYKRFSGNTNKNSGHSGVGFEAGAQLLTIDGRGLQFDASICGLHVNQMLRNFNNITLAYTDTYKGACTIGYGIGASKVLKLMPMAEVGYSRRLGTEDLFGASTGASYDKIGCRHPYLSTNEYALLLLPIEYKSAKSAATAIPYVKCRRYAESLTSVNREVKVSDMLIGIEMNYSCLMGLWLCNFSGGYVYKTSFSDVCRMSGYNPESELQTSVISTFDMLAADMNVGNARVEISRLFGKIMGGISVGYMHCRYTHQANANHFNASVNIKF